MSTDTHLGSRIRSWLHDTPSESGAAFASAVCPEGCGEVEVESVGGPFNVLLVEFCETHGMVGYR